MSLWRQSISFRPQACAKHERRHLVWRRHSSFGFRLHLYGDFPYTKRYIKRCMGKAGDTLYFYGGKIYGFDEEGNDLVELRDNPWTAAHRTHTPLPILKGAALISMTGNQKSARGNFPSFQSRDRKAPLSQSRDQRGSIQWRRLGLRTRPEAQKNSP